MDYRELLMLAEAESDDDTRQVFYSLAKRALFESQGWPVGTEYNLLTGEIDLRGVPLPTYMELFI